MTETKGTRDQSVVRYDDRLPVRGRALLPAVAMGVGAGLVVFYIARILAERTPLEIEPLEPEPMEPAPSVAALPARTRG